MGHLSLIFVLFALPAGFSGSRLGRKKTIIAGISFMTMAMLAMFILPVATLTIPHTNLPVLGEAPVISLILMVAGAAWALININSLRILIIYVLVSACDLKYNFIGQF